MPFLVCMLVEQSTQVYCVELNIVTIWNSLKLTKYTLNTAICELASSGSQVECEWQDSGESKYLFEGKYNATCFEGGNSVNIFSSGEKKQSMNEGTVDNFCLVFKLLVLSTMPFFWTTCKSISSYYDYSDPS